MAHWRRSKGNVCLGLVLFISLVLGTSTSQAELVYLSDFSSNGTVYTLAENLSVDLDFVVDDVNDILTLTVTNNTFDEVPASNKTAFDLNEIYFNIGGEVTGLAFAGNEPGWTVTVDPDNFHVNGFGMFDVALIDGQGSAPKAVKAGQTKVFTFNILTAGGSFSDADFTTHMSVDNGQPEIHGLAAGKFISGGPNDDDSAFGVAVPEPATIVLMGLGLLALLRKRKA